MSKFLKLFMPAMGGTVGVLALALAGAERNVTRPGPEHERVRSLAAAAPARQPGLAGRLIASPAGADDASADARPMAAGLSRDGGFGLGRAALPEEIAAWDIDIRPDGAGLPEGEGDVWTGEEVYVEKCAACHGDFGEARGRWPQLAGGFATLDRKDPVKTVGSYWPYLSTVWDYVHRAMPFGEAQSLSDDEVYALTAYILYLNDQVGDDFVLTRDSFAEVALPNADGFFMDDRAETELAAWRGEPCMENCKAGVEITMRARVLDVTPETERAEGAEAESADGAAAGDDAAAAAPADKPADEAAGETAAETQMAAASTEATASETPAAPAAAPAPPDPELVAAGEGVFRQCKSCHMVGEGAKNRSGPMLTGVVGRQAGSVEGFRYSPALTEAGAAGLHWTPEALSVFLADPRGYLKGNRMSFRGLRSDEDIAAIIAYLQSEAE